MAGSSDNGYRCIEFAGFALDEQARSISFAGEVLHGNDRMFEFLWTLASLDGELAEKNDLMDQLWPRQYVTEASLSRLVSDTRRLLAEHHPDQDLIQTIRGRGFRLRVPVTVSTSVAATGDVAAQSAQPFRVMLVALASVVLLVGLVFGAWWLWPGADETNTAGTVMVLPVQVTTGDDQDAWVEYGIMTMVAQQIQAYPSLSVMGVRSTIRGLADIGYETMGLSTDASTLGEDQVATICDSLGCDQLVSMHLTMESNQLVLQYRLYSDQQRSPVYRFVSNDALDAAEMLSEHLAAKLMPNSRERLDLQPFYTNDPVANRNLALGVNSLYHADYSEARVYLELALKRRPEFFWAKLFLADAFMRMGSYEEAETFLDEIDTDALTSYEAYEVTGLRSNLLYGLGQLEASKDLSLEAVGLAESLSDQERLGMALMNTGTSYTAMGNADAARAYLSQAAEVFRGNGFALREAQAQFNLANAIQVGGGDLDTVAELYRVAAATFLNCNANTYLAYALRGLGDINRSRKRFAEAEEQFERVSQLYREAGDVEGELFVATNLSGLALDTGDLAAAEAHAQRAYDGAGESFTYVRSYSAFLLVHVYLKQDRFGPIPELIAEVEGAEWADPRPSFALLAASYAHRRGDLSEAVNLALAVKADMAEAWTEAHEVYLDLFEASVAAGRTLAFNYFSGQDA